MTTASPAMTRRHTRTKLAAAVAGCALLGASGLASARLKQCGPLRS
jgi:hypothetical protein